MSGAVLYASPVRRRRRPGLRSGLAALCLWGSAALACGPAPSEPEESAARLRQALSGAQVERDYSGALALITVTRERVELCTATLLAPNLVATARHCVAATSADSVRCAEDPAQFAEPHAPERLWVSRERALRDSLASYGLLPITGGGDELVPVAEVFVPETQQVCGGDLALLLLAEPLTAEDAEPIAPRLDAPVEHGELYTAVGFGATPDPEQQGTRRSREGLQVTCTPDDCAGVAAVEETEFRGGDGVCSGDSGGPAIDTAGRVTGIASRSVDCTGSVYSALSRWRGFIREVAALAARAGDYPEPEWLVEALPEPEPELAEPEQAAPVVPEATEQPLADDGRATSDIERTPMAVPAASSEAGASSGCSLQGAPAAASWQALTLLLGLAAGYRARRSRISRRSAQC